MSILTDAPTVEFCEKAGNGLIARPYYALSNLAYLAVSFLILRKSKAHLARYFALIIGLVGFFSLIYDSYPKRVTQLFDLAGMYILASFLLVLVITRLTKKPFSNLFKLIVPALTLLSLTATYFLGSVSGSVIFGSIVIAYLVGEIYLNIKEKPRGFSWFAAGLAIFALAFYIWHFDFFAKYCMPGDYLNGRGVFHIMTGVTAYFIYKYYALNKDKFGIE